jgi:hypothetical protein
MICIARKFTSELEMMACGERRLVGLTECSPPPLLSSFLLFCFISNFYSEEIKLRDGTSHVTSLAAHWGINCHVARYFFSAPDG